MATRFIETVDPTSAVTISDIITALKNDTAANVTPIAQDVDTGKVHFYDRANAAVQEVVTAGQTQTLTNKTISGLGAASTGVVQVKGGCITELTGDGTYSISVALPAGAVLLDFIITQQALWTAGTSAALNVGDTDVDGYFAAIDAKTVPAVGTSLRPDTVPGGTGDGVYLGDTNGEFVGPATGNFGRVYVAGGTITAAITKSGTGTAGRTWFHVVYALPTTVAQAVS